MSTDSFGVCGSGTMGCGIAYSAALAGYDVIIHDISGPALERARERIEKILQGGLDRGKITAAGADEVRARIVTSATLDGFAACGIVVEAIVEDLQVKCELFARLETATGPETILASNTSSISITGIAAACKDPGRVVGMHFFNPAHIMKLVEVIQGHRTSGQTMDRAVAIAERLGKTPVRALDTPGFIVNRVARNFYGESLRIVGEGAATHAQVDRCMTALGFRMGPFELMDLIGIDVNLAVTESVYAQFFGEPRFRPHLIQQKMVEAGLLGEKSGSGFIR